MPVHLHHIVVDTHDLPRLAQFWTQALGWKILSEREREIVIGTDEKAPAGMCFMPVTDPKTVLADPEGNEFCVIRPRERLIR
jgi:predicted enzyme related to lactoylglutathione lyase